MGMWDACDSGILQFFYCLHVIYSWLYIEMQFANPLEPLPFTETALTQLKMIWEAVVRFSANTQRVLAGFALGPPFALPLNKALSSKSYLNFNRIRLIFVLFWNRLCMGPHAGTVHSKWEIRCRLHMLLINYCTHLLRTLLKGVSGPTIIIIISWQRGSNEHESIIQLGTFNTTWLALDL